MAKQDDYTRYTIRIPTPLYERVKDAAGEKSVNAEIVATLEEAYPEPEPNELQDIIINMMEEIVSLKMDERRPYLENLERGFANNPKLQSEESKKAIASFLKHLRATGIAGDD